MKNLFIVLTILLNFSFFPTESSAESPDMVLVKGTCFKMGTDKTFTYELGRDNIRERPAHKVCLDDFYLDKYEISQKKFTQIMNYNPSVIVGDDFPVNHLTWDEAVSYCSRQGYRLPTEAEWEFAARADSQSINPWGGGINGDYAWHAGNSNRQPHPVGTKKPNAWGIYDMMGGVWEWVADWYSESYYQKSPINNPQGPTTRQSWRVIRGASWVDDENMFRVTIRFAGLSDPTEHFLVGGRCAYTPKTKSK